jgi:hypothetical protein
MATRPTEEELLKNHERVEKLIELMPDDRRDQVLKMMDGPVGLTYFTAPASSHEDYHSCYPGGLAQHSLNVVRNLKKIADALVKGRYPDHQLAFVGLFHDLGKVGDGEKESYLPNQDAWQRNKGRLYEINKACPWMPTSERGLYILQDHEIKVTSDEYLAIRLNDGQYVDENKPYRGREPDLAFLLHTADYWSARQEKTD